MHQGELQTKNVNAIGTNRLILMITSSFNLIAITTTIKHFCTVYRFTVYIVINLP